MSRPLPADDDNLHALLGGIADEFADRLNRGESPDIETFARAHPECAEVVREILRPLVDLRRGPWSAGHSSSGGAKAHGALTGSASTGGNGPEVPRRLGDFLILREAGRGGMGVVYEALQESLGRRVALKLLPSASAADSRAVQRFQNEAQAAARLHHTNIVAIYGVGLHEGWHYIAMQFVEGTALDKLLERMRQSPAATESLTADQSPERGAADRTVSKQTKEPKRGNGSATVPGASAPSEWFHTAARMALQVADALGYAHAQGILHRDIKPANLLVDEQGTVWVTDFGVARLDGIEGLTLPGDVAGTLRYLAPERWNGTSDQRSDVYSLGLTLYELLAMRPAFDDTDRSVLIRRIVSEEPPRLRQVDPQIPRDLETIVHKAIDKSPARRYQTADALAGDLRSFLADLPIAARPIRWPQRLWRWCRRNPVVAALLASVALLLVSLAAGGWLSSLAIDRKRVEAVNNLARAVEAETAAREAARAERRHAQDAVAAQRAATERLWESLLSRAEARQGSGLAGQRLNSLAAVAEAAPLIEGLGLGPGERLHLRNLAIAAMPLVDVDRESEWTFEAPIEDSTLAFDAGLERYALGDRRGLISIRRLSDNVELRQLPAAGTHARILRFSGDGLFLAVIDDGGAREPKIHIWDIALAKEVLAVPAVDTAELAFRPGPAQVAWVGSKQSIRFFDLVAQAELPPLQAARAVDSLQFDPSGLRLAATAPGSADVEIFDVDSRLSQAILTHEGALQGRMRLAWSPDGRTLATASHRRIILWDVARSRQRAVLDGPQDRVSSLSFDRHGGLLASNGMDGILHFWNVSTGSQVLQIPSGGSAQFSTGDDRIAWGFGSRLGTLQVVPAQECQWLLASEIVPHVGDAGIHREGRLAATIGSNAAWFWDMATSRRAAVLPIRGVERLAFDAAGGDLFTNGAEGLLRWPIHADASGARLRIGPRQRLAAPSGRHPAALATGGGILAAQTGADFAELFLIDRPDRPVKLQPHAGLWSIAVSPDGAWAATGPWNARHIKIWDARSGTAIQNLPDEPAAMRSHVGFCPGGKWLVAGDSREFRFWHAGTWAPGPRIPRNSTGTVPGMHAFSPDGSLLAIDFDSRVLKLLDGGTGDELATLPAPSGANVSRFCFSPDGSRLLVGYVSHGVLVWDLRRVRERLARWDLDWSLPAYPAESDLAGSAPLEIEVVSGQGEK